MKKFNLLTKIFVLFLSANSFAQGLEGIIVEKYYIPTTADVTASTAGGQTPSTPLTTSSVTYRVYVDMLPNYKLLSVFGNSNHTLTISSTAPFFNDANYMGGGAFGGQGNEATWKSNTSALDSYLTMGKVFGSKQGVPKENDTDGTVGNTNNVLANNPGGCYGFPITGTTGRDGMMPGSTAGFSNVGIDASEAIFDNTTGLTFSMNGGSVAILGGVSGVTSHNRVLIGQFTTSGVLTFALNVQIQLGTAPAEVYVSSNAQSGETVFAGLTLAANTAPTIASFTANPSGSGIITGTSVTISANNVQDNGSVSSVQFYNGTTLLTAGGSTNGVFGGTAPNHTYTFTPANGSYSITAKATDNECVSTTTSALTFTVAGNQPPAITNLSATSTTPIYPGQSTINLSCTAIDGDAVSGNPPVSVTFSVAGGSPITATAGTGANINTYTATFPVTSLMMGGYQVTATATDGYTPAASATSNPVTFTVIANAPPTVTMTSPTAGSTVMASPITPATTPPTANYSMTLTATASDNDGYPTVLFYDLNSQTPTTPISGGITSTTGTYTFTYTALPGVHTYYAKATDLYTAAVNSPSITMEIADPYALSYRVKDLTQNCDATTYCMTVAAATGYVVNDVTGYEVSLKYDATKLTPTGNITLASTSTGMINPSLVEATMAQPVVSNGVGSLQILLNFVGGSANAEFNNVVGGAYAGNTDLFCIEFVKIPSNGTTGFGAIDNALLSDLNVIESYITGTAEKPGNNGSAISVKNQTYISNLEFWSDGQAIKYNSQSPNSYLKTDVNGSVSTTASAASGANAITVASAAGIAAGMTVVGNGVPAGTTVGSTYTAGNTSIPLTLITPPATVAVATATTAALTATPVTFVSSIAVNPTMSGVFTHSLLNGQDLRIERDIAASTPVQLLVNAADAVLAKTVVLNGNFTPSVFQMMALDVNLDGKVSAGDVSQMKQRATGVIDEYRQAWNYTAGGVSNGQKSKDWVFVDVTRLSTAPYQISSTFPAQTVVSGANVGYSKLNVPVAPFNLPAKVTNYASCPIVEVETYKGIMLGDVNASYAAYTATGNMVGLLKSENAAVVFDLASTVKEGNTFRIPVSFESTESTNALDFAVRFNENNVSFAELNNVAVGMEANAFMNADRTFRFTGFDVANFTVGATVAELVLQSNNETISEKDIIADLALLNGQPVDVKFEKSSEAIQSVFNVSIYPNPSNGAFSVQATENAIVDVYDMNGKQITASQVISSNGKVNIDLNNVEAGVYLVRVQNETFSTTKRIVIEK